ncbi:MAG: universal stress protein [Oscillatoriales cyanobacterium RM2_1_1]|nr:universal stress protein [Oscillatoriales cyanobacterium SM2_3_0]NJO48000.1 universal stress protein [Oscillatoriales cyanobacterium RM2_1_1]
MFKKILVALDLSSTSQAVFQQALAMATAMNAKLMLLHVLSGEDQGTPALGGMAGIGYYYGSLELETLKHYQERWQTYIDHSLEQLKSLAQTASDAGVIAEFTQTPGKPGQTICTQAKNWQADLILVGRRGHSGWSELFLGSVSNYVIHHAPGSVLVIQSAVNQKGKVEPDLNHSKSAEAMA